MTAIIDYGAGNLTSVQYALEALGASPCITREHSVIRKARRILFPGVGAAAAAMRHLEESGLAPLLRERIAAGVPFLGICLGTQILLSHSEEDGGTDMLGILSGRAVKFRPEDPRVKVPHMGWNQIHALYPHPLLAGLPAEPSVYFVHSYYPAPEEPRDALAATEYAGVRFASMLARGNVAATQFHPEKSGRVGLRILENFLKWDGEPC